MIRLEHISKQNGQQQVFIDASATLPGGRARRLGKRSGQVYAAWSG